MGNHKSCPRPDDYYKCKRNRCCLKLGHTGPPEIPLSYTGQEDQLSIFKRAAEIEDEFRDDGVYALFAVLLVLMLVVVVSMVYKWVRKGGADGEKENGGGGDGEGKSGGKVVDGDGKSEVSV